MDRRTFLKSTLVGGAAATALKARPAWAVNPNPPRRFIFINLGGGWDSTYSVDPKPAMATVSQAPGRLVEYTSVPGKYLRIWDWQPPQAQLPVESSVKRFFDAYWERSAIVKGINLRSVSHDLCAQRMYTGRQGGTQSDMATIIAYEKARDLPVPHLLINGPGWAGPLGAAVGRVGETGQLRLLIDPAQADFLSFRPTAQDEIDIEAFHLATSERQKAIRGSMGYNRARIQDFQDSLDRADRLRDEGKQLSFGGNGLMGQMDTALDVFRLNLAACVMLDDGAGYDTHGGNAQQGPSQDAVYAAMSYLGQRLEVLDDPLVTGSKMIDHTCVILTSEMTRTPRLNGGQGKDHWPVGAALIWGAGVNGGTQVGDTGEGQVAMPLDLATGAVAGQNLVSMSTEMFVAGVLSLAGVDPYPYFQLTPPLTALHQ